MYWIQQLQHNGLVTGDMASHVHRHGQPCDVGGICFDVHSQGGSLPAKALGAHPSPIDGFQHLLLQVRVIRVGVPLGNAAAQGLFGQVGHQRQKQQSRIDPMPNGIITGQRVRGLHRVGVYVPGGTAGYPSSVLMNVIPAQVAQVGEIVMATPPGRTGKPDPNILAAAYIAGVDRVFLMGGAQAVAALALGTESVPKVDKIVGPGNIFVATAKKQLYGVVDIDMIAGPSEILIVADETANPRYLAADLMSQAEHDPMASAILITNSRPVAEGTVEELTRQMATLSRREIIQQSLDRFGGVIICENLDEAVDFANELAPEHLEVCVQNPFEYIGRLDNAGSVFLGNYSPEPLGDYFAGANHVLPTGGTARFFSPLSVDDFIKKSSFIYYPKAELQKAAPDIIRLAETEELTAHANSIRVRVED